MKLNRELTRFARGSKLVSLVDDSMGCWLFALITIVLFNFHFNFLFNFHFNFRDFSKAL